MNKQILGGNVYCTLFQHHLAVGYHPKSRVNDERTQNKIPTGLLL